MRRERKVLPDRNGDPMEMMGNLFDVAIILGVGFLIMALSSIGLQQYMSKDKVTYVVNPGTSKMEIVTKQGNKVEVLKNTGQTASGPGAAVGTVYKLQNGQMVWVPGNSTP